MIDVSVSPARIHASDLVELAVSLTNTGPRACTNVIFTIRLPVGVIRLRGPERIEVSRLAPGQSVTSPLRIRAERAGRYELTSTNFSYRDHRGQPHRETSFTTEITVDPERDPMPEPHVTVGLQTAELPHDEWSILRGRIANTGVVGVCDLEITLSGQVTADQRSAHSTLEQLPAGHSADVPFFVRAGEAGAHVPVHLDVGYRDQSRRYMTRTTHSIRVAQGPQVAPPARTGPGQSVVKVLFLGANPHDTSALRLDEETREIQRVIRAGRERDNIDVSIHMAVRPADIGQALLDHKPHIVHFAGHGGGQDGSFAAEDDQGFVHIIPVDGLVQLFRVAGRSVECVIVNACSTELLARALSAHICYVVGMRQPVGDGSAIRFSIGFYQAVAAGLPIEDAFDLGVAQLMMMPVGPDQRAPVLFRRQAVG